MFLKSLPAGAVNLYGLALATPEAVMAELPNLKWREEPTPTSAGSIWWAVLDGNKLTRAVWVMVIMDRARAPKHKHTAGEFIVVLAGVMGDITDEGQPVDLGPGEMLFHAPGSIHEPYAREFAVVLYFQPEGSVLVDTPAAS